MKHGFNIFLIIVINVSSLFSQSAQQDSSIPRSLHSSQAGSENSRSTLNGQVGRYRLYEREFVSSTTYGNPFVDVRFEVQVSGPHGESFEVDGYWNGQNTWKIRIMPFSDGLWSYETDSNEPSLD